MVDFMQMMAWLCVILALVFVVLYVLKRYGPHAGLALGRPGDLKIMGQLGLGPKRNLVVVRFLDKILVLGVTDTQINLVTEMKADDATEFEDVLDNAQKGSPDSHSG